MEMGNAEQTNIKLIVDDEQSLYVSFSPEDEFSDSVKSYIKSKLSDGMHSRQGIDMTVISRKPIDEERFRSAVSNWIRDEKRYRSIRERKRPGSRLSEAWFSDPFLLILSIVLEQRVEVLKYSLLPIMGSLALSKAASVLVVDVPTIRVERWFFTEIEKNSVITFEYVHEEDPSPNKKLV